MAYKKPSQKFSGRILETVVGKDLKLGGESVLPFYSFDGNTGNKPALGIEIWDIAPSTWPEALQAIYKDCADDPVKWAKYCKEQFSPDFICVRFVGANPDGEDKTAEECAELAKKIANEVDIPLVIAGCDNNDKNAKIFTKIAEAIPDKRYIFLSAVEANYKEVGAAVALAYGNIVAAESSVDLNLAKQLNILITQLGVKPEHLVMDTGCAAVGYGYEYALTTLDRVKLAALEQNDTTLQMPIILPVSFETWKVKESTVTAEDEPDWGDQEERGIAMEVSTAAGLLAAGANAVILRHPRSLKVIRQFVNELSE